MDSNHRPTPYEGAALTAVLRRRLMERLRGIEPRNVPWEGTSLPLTYRRVFLFISFPVLKPLFEHLGYFLVTFLAVFKDEPCGVHVFEDMLSIVFPSTVPHRKITFRRGDQPLDMPELLPKIFVLLLQNEAFFLDKRQFWQHDILLYIYFFDLERIVVQEFFTFAVFAP